MTELMPPRQGDILANTSDLIAISHRRIRPPFKGKLRPRPHLTEASQTQRNKQTDTGRITASPINRDLQARAKASDLHELRCITQEIFDPEEEWADLIPQATVSG